MGPRTKGLHRLQVGSNVAPCCRYGAYCVGSSGPAVAVVASGVSRTAHHLRPMGHGPDGPSLLLGWSRRRPEVRRVEDPGNRGRVVEDGGHSS